MADYSQLFQQQLNDLQRQYAQLVSMQNQISPKTPGAGNTGAPADPQPQSAIPQPILYVDGIEGAKMLRMAPNTTIAVFDQKEAVFFVRSIDANGKEAPIKIGRFTLEDAPTPESNTLTRKDLEDFKAEIRSMLTGSYTPSDGGKRRKAEVSAVKNETEVTE